MKMGTVKVQKIRLNGSRPGRITKSRVVRNLFGTTKEDHTATNCWLKNELEQSFLQDRKKMESLGLDPNTGMPAENSASRWEWTAVDATSCPKIYRSRDLLSRFVKLSTKASPSSIVCSSENNRLDSVSSNTMVCTTTIQHGPSSSRTPKEFKQTTITDYMPQRRHRLIRNQLSPIFRSQKNLDRSVENSSAMQHQDTASDA